MFYAAAVHIPLPSRHFVLFVLVWLPAACRTKSEPAGTLGRADGATLAPGPIRHETLTPDQMKRIAVLQTTFGDVDPTPLEKWVDDFKRDRDPDREIAILRSHGAGVHRILHAPPRDDGD